MKCDYVYIFKYIPITHSIIINIQIIELDNDTDIKLSNACYFQSYTVVTYLLISSMRNWTFIYPNKFTNIGIGIITNDSILNCCKRKINVWVNCDSVDVITEILCCSCHIHLSIMLSTQHCNNLSINFPQRLPHIYMSFPDRFFLCN